MTLRTPLVKVASNNVALPSGDHVAGDIGLVTLTNNALGEDLVHAWYLNETSGTREDAIGDVDLTDHGTVGYESGKVGNAATFVSARSEYLSHSNQSDLQIANKAWQVTCWFKNDDTSKVNAIIGKGKTEPDNQSEFVLYSYSLGRLNFITRSADHIVYNVASTATPTEGSWHFITVWHDPDNDDIGISVNNGQMFIATAPTGGLFQGPGDFYIGHNSLSDPVQLCDGAIDAVHMWFGRLLTVDELTYMYNSGNGRELTSSSIGVRADAAICTPVRSCGPGHMVPARANSKSSAQVIGLVVGAEILVGDSGIVQTDGVLEATTAEWDTLTGDTGGLDEDTTYFLDPTTAGMLTDVAPTNTGEYLAPVGTALSATKLKIDIKQPILL